MDVQENKLRKCTEEQDLKYIECHIQEEKAYLYGSNTSLIKAAEISIMEKMLSIIKLILNL